MNSAKPENAFVIGIQKWIRGTLARKSLLVAMPEYSAFVFRQKNRENIKQGIIYDSNLISDDFVNELKKHKIAYTKSQNKLKSEAQQKLNELKEETEKKLDESAGKKPEIDEPPGSKLEEEKESINNIEKEKKKENINGNENIGEIDKESKIEISEKPESEEKNKETIEKSNIENKETQNLDKPSEIDEKSDKKIDQKPEPSQNSPQIENSDINNQAEIVNSEISKDLSIEKNNTALDKEHFDNKEIFGSDLEDISDIEKAESLVHDSLQGQNEKNAIEVYKNTEENSVISQKESSKDIEKDKGDIEKNEENKNKGENEDLNKESELIDRIKDSDTPENIERKDEIEMNQKVDTNEVKNPRKEEVQEASQAKPEIAKLSEDKNIDIEKQQTQNEIIPSETKTKIDIKSEDNLRSNDQKLDKKIEEKQEIAPIEKIPSSDTLISEIKPKLQEINNETSKAQNNSPDLPKIPIEASESKVEKANEIINNLKDIKTKFEIKDIETVTGAEDKMKANPDSKNEIYEKKSTLKKEIEVGNLVSNEESKNAIYDLKEKTGKEINSINEQAEASVQFEEVKLTNNVKDKFSENINIPTEAQIEVVLEVHKEEKKDEKNQVDNTDVSNSKISILDKHENKASHIEIHEKNVKETTNIASPREDEMNKGEKTMKGEDSTTKEKDEKTNTAEDLAHHEEKNLDAQSEVLNKRPSIKNIEEDKSELSGKGLKDNENKSKEISSNRNENEKVSKPKAASGEGKVNDNENKNKEATNIISKSDKTQTDINQPPNKIEKEAKKIEAEKNRIVEGLATKEPSNLKSAKGIEKSGPIENSNQEIQSDEMKIEPAKRILEANSMDSHNPDKLELMQSSQENPDKLLNKKSAHSHKTSAANTVDQNPAPLRKNSETPKQAKENKKETIASTNKDIDIPEVKDKILPALVNKEPEIKNSVELNASEKPHKDLKKIEEIKLPKLNAEKSIDKTLSPSNKNNSRNIIEKADVAEKQEIEILPSEKRNKVSEKQQEIQIVDKNAGLEEKKQSVLKIENKKDDEAKNKEIISNPNTKRKNSKANESVTKPEKHENKSQDLMSENKEIKYNKGKAEESLADTKTVPAEVKSPRRNKIEENSKDSSKNVEIIPKQTQPKIKNDDKRIERNPDQAIRKENQNRLHPQLSRPIDSSELEEVKELHSEEMTCNDTQKSLTNFPSSDYISIDPHSQTQSPILNSNLQQVKDALLTEEKESSFERELKEIKKTPINKAKQTPTLSLFSDGSSYFSDKSLKLTSSGLTSIQSTIKTNEPIWSQSPDDRILNDVILRKNFYGPNQELRSNKNPILPHIQQTPNFNKKRNPQTQGTFTNGQIKSTTDSINFSNVPTKLKSKSLNPTNIESRNKYINEVANINADQDSPRTKKSRTKNSDELDDTTNPKTASQSKKSTSYGRYRASYGVPPQTSTNAMMFDKGSPYEFEKGIKMLQNFFGVKVDIIDNNHKKKIKISKPKLQDIRLPAIKSKKAPKKENFIF